jgi:hypothetical protein
MPFNSEAELGQVPPAPTTAVSRASAASRFVHHVDPFNGRSASTSASRPSHFASARAFSSAARVSSVISKRCLSGRSTVMRW